MGQSQGRTARASHRTGSATAAAVLACCLTLAGCATSRTEDDPATDSASAATPTTVPTPTSPTARGSTPDTAGVDWQAGPSEDYVRLAGAGLTGEVGSAPLRGWADWLLCDIVDMGDNADAEGLEGMLPCRVDTGHGPANTVLIDWFTRVDNTENPSGALLASAFASSSDMVEGICEASGTATVVFVLLAGGYHAVIVDPDMDVDGRYDTAVDIADATDRAAAAVGLDTDNHERPETISC